MVQPAPRMMRAPAKKSAEVLITVRGGVVGLARGAARRVEKRQGRKR